MTAIDEQLIIEEMGVARAFLPIDEFLEYNFNMDMAEELAATTDQYWESR